MFVKFWILKNHYRVQHDKAFCAIHHPFMRTDLDKLSIVWSFPWYCTFWPRFLLAWTNGFICSALFQIVMIGADKKNLDEERSYLVKQLI
jgi:hypothetical protein